MVNQDDLLHTGSGGRVPVPDPTRLTTAALTREILALKELVFTRIEAIERAMAVVSADIIRESSEIDKRVMHLKEVTWERFGTLEERFLGINARFRERDNRRMAENTAFATAIDKAEAALTKQMDQQRQTIDSARSEFDVKIGAVKDRLLLMEGQGGGERESRNMQRAQGASVVNLLGLIIGTLLAAAGILFGVLTR